MQIPKDFLDFCNREELKDELENFSGKYYWISFIEQYYIQEDRKTFLNSNARNVTVKDYHPFIIITVMNFLSRHNIVPYNESKKYFLSDYKEISEKEYEIFKILEEIECQEYQK